MRKGSIAPMRILAIKTLLPAALAVSAHAWGQGYGYSAPVYTGEDVQDLAAPRGVSLGALRVISAPTEPLRAEIPIYGLNEAQIGGFTAIMADEVAYERAGLLYDPIVALIHIQAEISALSGEPVLVLTTESAVDRATLELLLEAKLNVAGFSQNYGQIYRPLIFAGMAEEGGEWPGTQPPVPTLSDNEDAPLPTQTTRKGLRTKPQAHGDVYIVRRGDTLSGIAARHLSDGVEFEQMLAALYSRNRKTLTLPGPMGHAMHHLQIGMRLIIPAPEEALQRSRAQAWQIDEPGYLAFNEYRRKLSGGELAAPQRAPSGTVSGAQSGQAGKDRLTLDRAASSTAAQPPLQIVIPEGIYAKSSDFEEVRRQLTELSGGIRRLNDNVADIKNHPPQTQTPTPGYTAVPQSSAPAIPRGVLQTLADYGPFVVVSLLIGLLVALVRFLIRALRGGLPRRGAKQAPLAPPPAPPPAQAAQAADAGYAQPEFTPAPPAPVEEEAPPEPTPELAEQTEDAMPPQEPTAIEEPQSLADAPLPEAEEAVQVDLAMDDSQLPAEYDPLRDDPVQQAELHLRLGEDSRAEGVLVEGMGNFPDRLDIRRKLLDYYAERQDAPAFEQVAQRLYELTGAQGEDWEAVAEQGRALDPGNPFYAVDSNAEATASDATEPVMQALEEVQGAEPMPLPEPEPAIEAQPAADAPGAQTQLALAEEFLAIGNTEEARQILEELMSTSSGDVQSRAHEMLNRLS